MNTIWKFPLAVANDQLITIPKGAEILTVQRQGTEVCLWAMVSTLAETERRVIEIHGTGNPMDQGMCTERKYIGTFQQPPFVWHVFERTN